MLGKKKKHTLINKYGASREIEVFKTVQRKEMSGVITARQRATVRLKEKDKDDVNGWGEKRCSITCGILLQADIKRQLICLRP